MIPLIRPMRPADIRAVRRLGCAEPAFGSASGSFWSANQLRQWCLSPHDVTLVATNERALLGFVLVAVHGPTGKATIENALVKPAARGLGLGRLLLRAAMAQLAERGVPYAAMMISAADRAALVRLAERLGFSRGPDVTWADCRVGKSTR